MCVCSCRPACVRPGRLPHAAVRRGLSISFTLRRAAHITDNEIKTITPSPSNWFTTNTVFSFSC